MPKRLKRSSSALWLRRRKGFAEVRDLRENDRGDMVVFFFSFHICQCTILTCNISNYIFVKNKKGDIYYENIIEINSTIFYMIIFDIYISTKKTFTIRCVNNVKVKVLHLKRNRSSIILCGNFMK